MGYQVHAWRHIIDTDINAGKIIIVKFNLCVSVCERLPGTDVAVVHVGGDDAGDAGATTLTVQHDHIARILGEPGVHGLAERTQAL